MHFGDGGRLWKGILQLEFFNQTGEELHIFISDFYLYRLHNGI